ncbi:hypothetical protein ACFLY7_00015 [Patescibacteria group bacterium]
MDEEDRNILLEAEIKVSIKNDDVEELRDLLENSRSFAELRLQEEILTNLLKLASTSENDLEYLEALFYIYKEDYDGFISKIVIKKMREWFNEPLQENEKSLLLDFYNNQIRLYPLTDFFIRDLQKED